MTYLFNTPEHQREMLATIGVSSIDDLFATIPQSLRLNRSLELPPAMTEMELEAAVGRLADANGGASRRVCMMGGGAYDHFIPAVVDELAGRGEFYTAYTPYQAEASQGSLQAFFEYQSLICQLTGLDVANASLYEGGTAVSEAAFMAMRITGRHQRVVVAGSVHPEYRQVLQTYLEQAGCEVTVIPSTDGAVDPEQVALALDDRTACVIFQHPNFFGCLEDVSSLTAAAHRCGALAVAAFDPISVGLLQRPGQYAADIAVAEGQPLGIPMQYGGPLLGVLACRGEYVRKMPGRLVGRAKDRAGRDCYVLNLQAREQHIRRDKATSNICTNQGLLALRATVYLSLVGPDGIREVAELCCRKAHYAAQALCAIDGIDMMFDRPYFKEFVLRVNSPATVISVARAAGFDLGPQLDRFGDEQLPTDGLLVAITEKRTKAEIDQLVDIVRQAQAAGQTHR